MDNEHEQTELRSDLSHLISAEAVQKRRALRAGVLAALVSVPLAVIFWLAGVVLISARSLATNGSDGYWFVALSVLSCALVVYVGSVFYRASLAKSRHGK